MSNRGYIKFFLLFLSFMAGFIVAATIAFTYTIPLYKKQSDDLISKLNIQIDELRKSYASKLNSLNIEIGLQKNNINTLDLNNTKLIIENEKYKNQLLNLPSPSTFQHGQPLPIGYSGILPGMKISDVVKKYDKDILDIAPDGDAIIVNVKTSEIAYIIYSTGIDEFSNIITSILVSNYNIDTLYNEGFIGSSADKHAILNLLHKNLGPAEQCSTDEYIWVIGNDSYVYHNVKFPSLYHIFIKGVYAPGTSSACLKMINSLFSDDK